jgi:hypothetical protein
VKAQEDANIGETLLQIVQKGALAYRQHTGEAVNPALIKTEEPV